MREAPPEPVAGGSVPGGQSGGRAGQDRQHAAADGRDGAVRARRRIVWWLACVALPLTVFAGLALGVRAQRPFAFDEPLLLQMRAWTGPALDRLFVAVSAVGHRYGVIPVDVLATLALAALRRWREAGFAAAAFAGSALLNMGAKAWFRRERPTLWESIVDESSFSFPSGHAMGSSTLALVAVLLAWRTSWRVPVLVAAVGFAWLVGGARVYLGVHFPSDIAAGWALASAWVAAMYLVWFPSAVGPWTVAGGGPRPSRK